MYIHTKLNIILMYKFLFIFILILFITSCVHTNGVASQDVYVVSGDVAKKININKRRPTIYVSSQNRETDGSLLGKIQDGLKTHGFKITRRPSSADLILQVTIPYSGSMSLSGLERTVALGYDARILSDGNDVSGIVADVLLVTRSVPEAKNEKQATLKSISQRQAIASSALRLGVYSAPVPSLKPFPSSFVSLLSSEICKRVLWVLSK